MSAFAVIYERDNPSVEPEILDRVMNRLEHRGPDGRDTAVFAQFAMGHCHFWTTPEEIGECQPLELAGLPFKIVLDGRIDNRKEIISLLELDPSESKLLSDAGLILHAYARWGQGCFEHFVGEYALAILDQQRCELFCARDALGTRTLFYAWHGSKFIIASEAWATAGALPFPPKLNERAAAHFFSFQVPEDGQSLFDGVYELLPGNLLHITQASHRSWQYWHPDFSKKLRYKTDEDYASHFLSLLEESISCRMRSATPIGVLMSGGLDSSSVACLAARMLSPQRLTTISSVFDEFPESDEREYINAVTTQYNTRSIEIPSDHLYPFHNWPDWPFNPNFPIWSIYPSIRERAYQEAHQEGIRVLLTGDFGDGLYSGASDWLADLLSDGRFRTAGKAILYHLRHSKSKQKWLRASFLQIARRILEVIPFNLNFRQAPRAPVWLTSFAVHQSAVNKNRHALVSDRLDSMAGLFLAQSSVIGSLAASKEELELRTPYRDCRLVEFMLALPAYQIYDQGIYRVILRRAMRGILPEMIRTRSGKTGLMPLYFHGLAQKKNELETFFSEPCPVWKEYVDESWLAPRWQAIFGPEQDGAARVVPWLCVAFLVWYKQIFSHSQVD